MNTQAVISEADVTKQTKEKKSRSRNDSMSSTNSVETVKSKGRKTKLSETENKYNDNNNRYDALSPVQGDEAVTHHAEPTKKTTVPNGQAKFKESNSHSFSVNGLLGNEKTKLNSPLNTPVVVTQYIDESKHIDVVSSSFDDTQTENTETDEKVERSDLKNAS